MMVAVGHRDAPVETGAGNAEILQPAFDKAQNFVTAGIGLNEVRVLGIVIEQRLLIFGKAEEPALLDRPFDRRALRRQLCASLIVGELVFLVISLVADGVPTFVAVEVKDLPSPPLPSRSLG